MRQALGTVGIPLEQSVVDGRLAKNLADYVKLPKEPGTKGGKIGDIADRAMCHTPVQVLALVDTTPWPYNTLVTSRAWAGLRAAKLGGFAIANFELPDQPLNPNAPAKPGVLRVEQAARANGSVVE